MIVRFEGKRVFKVWAVGETWYGVETKHLNRGKLTIPYKACFSGGNVDEVVDRIEEKCKFDQLVGQGMDSVEAANLVLFGE